MNKNNVFFVNFVRKFFCIADKFPFTGDHRDFKNTGRENLGTSVMPLRYTFDSGRHYTECFGMKLLRKRDVPDEKYTNAFLGFGPEDTNFALELTYSMFTNLPKKKFVAQKLFQHSNSCLHVCQPDNKKLINGYDASLFI